MLEQEENEKIETEVRPNFVQPIINPLQQNETAKNIVGVSQNTSFYQSSIKEDSPEDTVPSIKSIRTYQDDIRETIESRRGSIASIALAQQKKKDLFDFSNEEARDASEAAPEHNYKKTITIILVVLMMVLGASIFGYSYFVNQKSATTKVEETVPSLVFAENAKKMDITGVEKEDLKKMVSMQTFKEDYKLSTITNLYFVEKGEFAENRTTLQRFFFLIDSSMPQSLSRSLDREFMYGVHSWNGNQAFIVTKTRFYENAFAGMLEWEKNMASDLLMMLGKNGLNEQQLNIKFEDDIIKNRDVRVLRDTDTRQILLLYMFKDRNTIIITTNVETLDEVLSRLNNNTKI